MLVPAILREQDLRPLFMARMAEQTAKYYYFQAYRDFDLIIDRNDWNRIQYVSQSSMGELFALYEARINHESNIVENILILSLRSQGLSFEAVGDLFGFVRYLFQERGFRKIFVRYLADNPASGQYEKLLIRRAGCGSIQGVLREYITLADQRNYDLVILDIQREPYLQWFHGPHALHPAT